MRVLIAGDFCPRERVSQMIENSDYSTIFSDVSNLIKEYEVDYSIVNFECPIVLSNANPIEKIGPNLKCTSKAVDAIDYAGFDCVTLANNHILDYGESAMNKTIHICSERGMDIVGVGNNLQDARRILYKQVGDKILAIINCCEHEFSVATDSSAGANPLNPIQQYYDIQEAKSNADYVLVIVHGGHEGYQLPSVRMVDTYRFFVDAGADAVVNHHQHCFSGYEVYNGKPIFYGLGNFCFEKKNVVNDIWNYGYMVVLEFTDGNICFDYIPYNQCSDEPKVKIISKDKVRQDIEKLNKIILSKDLLLADNERFYLEGAKSFLIKIEPINNRIYTSLRCRGILKSIFPKRFYKMLYAFTNCESHRDKLLVILKKL